MRGLEKARQRERGTAGSKLEFANASSELWKAKLTTCAMKHGYADERGESGFRRVVTTRDSEGIPFFDLWKGLREEVAFTADLSLTYYPSMVQGVTTAVGFQLY